MFTSLFGQELVAQHPVNALAHDSESTHHGRTAAAAEKWVRFRKRFGAIGCRFNLADGQDAPVI